jgi:CheY-like chemotaxis protein
MARALIVDADRAARRELESALSDDGHVALAAAGEREALGLARGARPELLLIDPRLPDGDGRRLVRELRRDAPLPLILLGRVLGPRAAALESGGVYVHAKPIDAFRLTIQVRRALRAGREDAAPPTLRGPLSLMGLPALLSHLEAEGRTGRLTLRLSTCPEPAVLDCRGGRLLRARIPGDGFPRNRELIYALLPLASGSFEFRPCVVEGEDEIGLPIPALLLEGARRIDELSPVGSNPDRPFPAESGSPGGSTV